MSSSETGCGDGEELGLEAAAEAGGLTNFSTEERERRAKRKHTNKSGHTCLMPSKPGKSQATFQMMYFRARLRSRLPHQNSNHKWPIALVWSLTNIPCLSCWSLEQGWKDKMQTMFLGVEEARMCTYAHSCQGHRSTLGLLPWVSSILFLRQGLSVAH